MKNGAAPRGSVADLAGARVKQLLDDQTEQVDGRGGLKGGEDGGNAARSSDAKRFLRARPRQHAKHERSHRETRLPEQRARDHADGRAAADAEDGLDARNGARRLQSRRRSLQTSRAKGLEAKESLGEIRRRGSSDAAGGIMSARRRISSRLDASLRGGNGRSSVSLCGLGAMTPARLAAWICALGAQSAARIIAGSEKGLNSFFKKTHTRLSVSQRARVPSTPWRSPPPVIVRALSERLLFQ